MPRPYRPSPLRQSTTPPIPLIPQFNRMPPTRRSRAPPPPRQQPPPAPPSSLAKQHRISASTESSIRTAFDLFATKSTLPHPSSPSSELTLPTPSLRRALIALSAPARSRADLQDLIAAADPLATGEISYENFVAVAVLQIEVVGVEGEGEEDGGEGEDEEGEDGVGYMEEEEEEDDDDDGYAVSSRRDATSFHPRISKAKAKAKSTSKGKGKSKGQGQGPSNTPREIDEAFRLFIGGGGAGGGGGGGGGVDEVITIGALRRVARELKEDVAEGLLKDMILEANGGAGVGKGVRRGEFEAVMRRAGVFR